MQRYDLVAVVLLIVWGLIDTTKAATAEKKKKNPHILLVVVDALATGGVYLEQYYVLPYCSPTRAALMSGKYPLHTGVHSVIRPISTAGLPLRDETLADLLKRAGYHTNAIGKWHIGHSSWEQTPTFRGFDEFFGYYYGAEGYFSHEHEGGYDMRHDERPHCGKDCSKTVDERGQYSSPLFARETIRMMKAYVAGAAGNDTVGPLFQYVAFQAVHCPNQVPVNYIDMYVERSDWSDQRKVYAGMLTAADDSLGEIVQAYQQAGIWNDTLVIFTTDNGGPTTLGCATGASNYPKRGGKTTLWEGGCTGDGFVSGPALPNRFGVSGGTRFPHLFHVVDWFPSIAEWIGVVPMHQDELDGRSHVENLRQYDLPPARTELFIGFVEEPGTANNSPWFGPSLRHLNWKIIQGTSAGADDLDPHPTGTPHPMPGGMANASYLLFDLDRDPGETTNLADEYPDKLDDLVFKLKLFQQSYVPPQANDDSGCKWPGFVDDPNVGPTW
jgi:arylsulfatase B/arylsulfatase I/J